MIFITGSSSFVGQKLIKKLREKKINFTGIDHKVGKFSGKNIFKKNINDKNISKLIKKNSTIIHLAAISNVKDCEKNPRETLRTNINGTINLIEQSITQKAKHFIFASTEWVYPNQNKLFNENSNINIDLLDNNYAVSKLIGERILSNYSNKIKISILRFGIIYSNRKTGGSAVESLINTIKISSQVKVGSKNSSRRFIHIDDIIESLIISYKKQSIGIFNISGDKDINLQKILNLGERYLNKKVKIVETAGRKPNKRKISNFKARKIMGWSPKINIETGVKQIISRE